MPTQVRKIPNFEMQHRFLGQTGLKVSAFSLGSWITFGEVVDQDACNECLLTAYENGINFFDGAEVYAHGKAELAIASTLKKYQWSRDSIVLSTKIFWGGSGPNQEGLSAKHLVEGLNASLKRYQVDYVDLVYCHRPDKFTPLEETVRTMDMLIKQGKALYWGTSEWSAADIGLAYGIALNNGWHPPLFEQPQYNMFHRERFEKEYEMLYHRIGYGATIWSPLCGGVLTGKYQNEIPQDSRFGEQGMQKNPDMMGYLKRKQLTPHNKERVHKLLRVAQKLECSMSQLALAWTLKNKHVSSTILGATKPEQIVENLQALPVVSNINEEVMAEIESILQNKPESFVARS